MITNAALAKQAEAFKQGLPIVATRGKRFIFVTVAFGALFPWISCYADNTGGSSAAVSALAGFTFLDEQVRFAMVEARAPISSHVALAATVAYLDGTHGYGEFQLRLGAIGTIDIAGWTLENRQLVSFNAESTERYRNRLRVIRPGLFNTQSLSVRAYDELFVDLDRGRFIRNNVALGIGAQISSELSAELYHVWVDNRAGRDQNYFLVLMMLRL